MHQELKLSKSQKDWDEHYMKVAELTAQMSQDTRKVGAIIVKENNIISFSYNGTLAGTDNTMRDASGRTLHAVLHAETQAIAKVAKSTQSTVGGTMYTTLSPCIECAKMVAQVGIVRLVYGEQYKYTEGVEFLKKNSVYVNQEISHNLLADPKWLAKTGL